MPGSMDTKDIEPAVDTTGFNSWNALHCSQNSPGFAALPLFSQYRYEPSHKSILQCSGT